MSTRLMGWVCLALSCGGSSHPADALTADDACATAARTRCQKLMGCSAADLDKRFGDVATCEAREALACTAALAATGTGNTPATVVGCADAIQQQACGDFLGKSPPNACLHE